MTSADINTRIILKTLLKSEKRKEKVSLETFIGHFMILEKSTQTTIHE